MFNFSPEFAYVIGVILQWGSDNIIPVWMPNLIPFQQQHSTTQVRYINFASIQEYSGSLTIGQSSLKVRYTFNENSLTKYYSSYDLPDIYTRSVYNYFALG